MRMLVALSFDDAVKDVICAAIDCLRLNTIRGNFTL